jgi:hypothetical protein
LNLFGISNFACLPERRGFWIFSILRIQ